MPGMVLCWDPNELYFKDGSHKKLDFGRTLDGTRACDLHRGRVLGMYWACIGHVKSTCNILRLQNRLYTIPQLCRSTLRKTHRKFPFDAAGFTYYNAFKPVS